MRAWVPGGVSTGGSGRRGTPHRRREWLGVLQRVDQQPGIAKALDLIGDRWTLLIVRELLALGPSRHTDLRNGLPGIASNLLVDRLRELEEAGLIRREAAPPPVATTLFTLTDRGRELESVLRELSRWGVPLLHESPGLGTFRTHWLAQPARALTDRTPDAPAVAIQLHAEDNEDLVLEVNHGVVHTHPGRVDEPAATLTGPPKVLTALLTGGLSLHDAEREGLHVSGELDAVRRILPGPPTLHADTTEPGRLDQLPGSGRT